MSLSARMLQALAGAAALALLAACGGPGYVPADPAAQEAAGVRVTARADAWTGEGRVPRYVTPVLITVANGGALPLRIQYRQFALLGPEGSRFAALPPFQVPGGLHVPLGVLTAGPAALPGFVADGFEIAGFYAALYPDLPVADSIGFEPLYYNYYAYWYDTWLPNAGMLVRALPEGVLNPGGRVRGYLYFEKVNPALARVQLRLELAHPRGRRRGVIVIPLEHPD